MENSTANFMEWMNGLARQGRVRAPDSLRRNFVWVFGGNAVFAMCNWGILVILAKLGSTEAVGQFALGLAIASPIFIFAGLNLRAVQATDAKNLYNLRDYFLLRCITIVLAIAATVTVSFVIGYDLSLIAIILAVTILKSTDSISDISHGLYQKHETMYYIATAMMIKGPVSLLVFFITYLLFQNIIISILFSASLRLLIFFAYERPLTYAILLSAPDVKKSGPSEPMALVRLALLALPLGLVAMINSLAINIPRFFVEKFNGMEQLGIFAGIAYILVAGGTVVTAMGQSASPRLARYFADGQFGAFGSLLSRMIIVAIALGTVGICAAVLFGALLLEMLYSSDYAAYGDVFTLIMIAALFSYVSSFLGFGMTAARKFRVQAPISIFSLFITCLLSVMLIPSHGLAGACYCLILLYIVQIPVKFFVILRSMQP